MMEDVEEEHVRGIDRSSEILQLHNICVCVFVCLFVCSGVCVRVCVCVRVNRAYVGV